MISIPPAICWSYRNNFKHHYLKNKRPFFHFLLHFWNVHEIKSIFLKKDEYPNVIISGIVDSERHGYLNDLKVLLQNTIR